MELARKIPLEVHGNEPRGGTLIDIKITKHFGFQIQEAHWIVNEPSMMSERGGHFHKNKKEVYLIQKGEAEVILRNTEGKTETLILSEKEPVALEILPYIHHTVSRMSEGAILLVLQSETWNAENADTYSEFD